jgi:hypothetical protein
MKGLSLMAVAAMMTTAAFAGTGKDDDYNAQDKIALNKIEIRQQQEQNDDLQQNIAEQQSAIFDLIKEKTSLKNDLQLLEDKQQHAVADGKTGRVNRLSRRIAWDQALLKANTDHIREYLAAERNDMRLINHNGARIDQEEAAISSISN